uniref:CSON002242 protein n=1 Tax=Culicoides sonorensis TaxID=179676 RepID=A0A336MPP9_CULSO
MKKLIYLIFCSFVIQIRGEFSDFFGSAARSLSFVPPPATGNCRIIRSWELVTSFIPDQERARAAYRIMEKALRHLPIDLKKLLVVGALGQVKPELEEYFKISWTQPRIDFLYSKMEWKKNEIPYWIHTSGDVAATLSGLLLYSHYSTKNRDINGYYISENSFKGYERSHRQKEFEKTPHFKEAFDSVNNRLRFYLNRYENFSVEEVLAAYDLCRHLYVTFHVKRDNVLWCKAFFEADLEVFEFYEELNLSNGNYHNSSDLAPNVCGIVKTMENTLNNENGDLGVTFFTTTQQFLPILKSLGLLREVKPTEFEIRHLNPYRINNVAGRLSSLTIYRYGPGCNLDHEIFINGRKLTGSLKSKKYADLPSTLWKEHRCAQYGF